MTRTEWQPWKNDTFSGTACLFPLVFPALVTEVHSPNADGDSLVLRTSAFYDARGRADSRRVHDPLGDGVNVVTRYGWNDAVDRPVWVLSPGAAIVRFGYISHVRRGGQRVERVGARVGEQIPQVQTHVLRRR